MGSPEDEWGRALVQEDQVLVTLTRPFIIQQTEVTQAEWTSHGLANPSQQQSDGRGDCLDDLRCPVGTLTWFEAAHYANLISQEYAPPLEPCYVLHGCQGEVGKDFYCDAAEAAKPTVYDCDPYGTVGLHPRRSNRGGSIIDWSSSCRSASKLSSNWNLRMLSAGLRLARTGTLDDL